MPIRSMQMLAILDHEECVFLDINYKSWVELAWQSFRAQERTSLDEPVPFEMVIYHPDGVKNRDRLMSEFPKALQLMAEKDKVDGPAKVLKFSAKRPASADKPR
ncbi:MAG: hypothetical protein AABY83_07935 [Pseudomonadota bacterium]